MSQPATAAIIVGAIVGGAALLFVSYKIYVKVYWKRHRTQMDLPPTRDATDFSSRYLMPSQSNTMAGTLYGSDTYGRDSWKGSQSRASVYSHLDRQAGFGSEASFPSQSQRRSTSSQALLLQSPPGIGADLSSPSSPVNDAVDSGMPGFPRPLSALEVYDPIGQHTKNVSSASSTNTIKRSYASSIKSSGGMTYNPVSNRRDSYLPHLPENRDQIQITPPQPLGFGLGGMATALDQKTLAFSTNSGIGAGDQDFLRGLVWQEGNPEAAAAVLQRASKLGEEERLRYLAQGPRAMSPMMRGHVHNHLYAGSTADSSGVRTPDVPSSRSRSPAAATAAWDGASTSDIGPSVSQRGAVSPSQAPQHPLEQIESMQSNNSLNPRGGYLTSQQSPLGMMSGGMSDELGLRSSDDPSPRRGAHSNGSSPILSAFRNPSPRQHPAAIANLQQDVASHSHSNSQNSIGSAGSRLVNGERTPGLASASVSTDNGSGSARTTDGGAAPFAQSPEGERRITVGKDGQLQVMGLEGQANPENLVDADKRQSRGWHLGRLMGSKT